MVVGYITLVQGFAESLQRCLECVKRKPYCVPYMEVKVCAGGYGYVI